MKNFNSFFYSKKIVRIKHSDNFSSLISANKKNIKKKKNVLLYMLRDKEFKKSSQKVKFTFQKNTNKHKITIKNQWKKNIHAMYYLKVIYNFKFICWSNNMAFAKTFFLNWLNLNQIYKNIPLKIKKILYFFNIFKNFDKIFFSIFNKCQKTLMFSFFYSKNINCKQDIHFLRLLQKKFLNKKLKFAILLFQIFFKNVKKFLKNFIAKFDFHFLKNLHFLFIQLFLELQFSLFLILKDFQNFLVEKNVLQIFLQKHFFTQKKETKLNKVFSFVFKKFFSPQLNNRKFKILNFFLVFYLKQKNNYFHLNFYQKVLEQKKNKSFEKKTFLVYNKKMTLSKKQQTNQVLYFHLWKFFCQNFHKLIYKKNLKFLYELNIQNKHNNKLCFLFSHNILKVSKIFSIFFYFIKNNVSKTFTNKDKNKDDQFQKILKIDYVKKLGKNSNLASRNSKFSKYILNSQTNKINFVFSLTQILNFHNNNILNKTQKTIFCVFIKFIKENTQLFFEYFCSLNCLKTHIDFFQNWNDFQMLFYQQLKSSFFHVQSQNNMKFSMQSLIYRDYFTFFSFLKIFPIITTQKNQNHYFLNIFSQFLNLYSTIKMKNLHKIDQIHLLSNFKKKICETNIRKFLKFSQKNFSYLFKNHFILQRKQNLSQMLTFSNFAISANQRNKVLTAFCQRNQRLQKLLCCLHPAAQHNDVVLSCPASCQPVDIMSKNYSLSSKAKLLSLRLNYILSASRQMSTSYRLLSKAKLTACQSKIDKFVSKDKLILIQELNQQVNQKSTNDLFIILFKIFYSYFEKNLFHLYKTLKLQQIKNYFSKKYNFVSFLNFSCFQNFCIKNKCFKNSIIEPNDLIYKYYYESFVLFHFIVYLFLKNQKHLNFMKIHFHKCEILNKYFLKNFENNQIYTKNNIFRTIPLMNLFQIFYINISKKQKKTMYLLYFQKEFWLLSKKVLLKSTKFNNKYFFSFSAFCSSFFIQKSKNSFWSQVNKYRTKIFLFKNFFHFNFEGFSIYLNFIWKKKSRIFFVFQKNKTSQNIQIHLKQCQQILKNSIGKKQLFFMKKLQKKIKIWCQEYKNILYSCEQNSVFVKLSAKKTFYYCDSMLLKYLWNWAQKTHPNKSKIWIKKKYFHFIHSKKWFFGKKVGKVLICLPLHSQTKI